MWRFKENKGFVLPMVLFFMQLFALLGWYTLQITAMELKETRDAWHYKQYENAALNILAEVEYTFIQHGSKCMLPVGYLSNPSQKSVTWWQLNSCSGNLTGNRYYYLFEFLGKDTCAKMVMQDGMSRIAQYYRITLLSMPEMSDEVKIFLQSTIAIASDEKPECHDNLHSVMTGRQMWRRVG